MNDNNDDKKQIFDSVMERFGDRLGSDGWCSMEYKLEYDEEMFSTVCDFLDLMGPPIKSKNPNFSSYGLKHTAADWAHINKRTRYISNGMMIAGIIAKGYAPKNLGSFINIDCCISNLRYKQVAKQVQQQIHNSNQ